jgi:hypothetical protein
MQVARARARAGEAPSRPLRSREHGQCQSSSRSLTRTFYRPYEPGRGAAR